MTFVHVCNLLKPASWTLEQFNEFESGELLKLSHQLKSFVQGIYNVMDRDLPEQFTYHVMNRKNVCKGVVEYARQEGFDFIALSTKGAGMVKRIIGTHATEFIKTAEFPVLVVPGNYRRRALHRVLYATDMENPEQELTEVLRFTSCYHLHTDVLHIGRHAKTSKAEIRLKNLLNQFNNPNIQLVLKPANYLDTLLTNIKVAIVKQNPSLVVTFTHPPQGIIERILDPGISTGYVFNPKVPILVMRKK